MCNQNVHVQWASLLNRPSSKVRHVEDQTSNWTVDHPGDQRGHVPVMGRSNSISQQSRSTHVHETYTGWMSTPK